METMGRCRNLVVEASLLYLVLTVIGSQDAPASELIVDWGGDYVDTPLHTNRVLRGGRLPDSDHTVDVDGDGDTRDDVVSYYAFSLTTPFSPRGRDEGPSYNYDATKPSAVFYGGAVSYFADDPNARIPEAACPVDHYWGGKTDPRYDDVGLRGGNGWGFDPYLPVRHYAVFLWKKQDFLAGSAAHQTVRFDTNSALRVIVSRKWFGLEEGRFVVQDGEQLYVSEEAFTMVSPYSWGLANPELREVNPLVTRWAFYSPSGYDLDFDDDSVFMEHEFTDVQAVGFYVDKDELTAELTWITFSDFEVEAQVIPEPSIALLAALAFTCTVFGKRRRPSARPV